uniref:Serine-threonine protein kinase, plant-type n=1 Tax=Solanum tuberosum TaxID=4113 RepID=M1BRJ5_SOLTU
MNLNKPQKDSTKAICLVMGVSAFRSFDIECEILRNLFAAKVFNVQLEHVFRNFDIECEILRNLRHRNLTKVITSCSKHDFNALVLETFTRMRPSVYASLRLSTGGSIPPLEALW